MDLTVLYFGDLDHPVVGAFPDLTFGGKGAAGKFCTFRQDDALFVVFGPAFVHDAWDCQYCHSHLMDIMRDAFPSCIRSGGGYYEVRPRLGGWQLHLHGESGAFGRFSKDLLRPEARSVLIATFGMDVEIN